MSGRRADDLDADFAPCRRQAVYTVAIDGEAVLLDEAENRLHHLNHTASLFWACFDGDTSLAQLASEVSEELALPYDAVLSDAVRITRELAREGLLDDVETESETVA